MQKWEYLVLSLDREWAYLNGERLERSKTGWHPMGPALAALLNKLGAEGWELVTSDGNGILHWFKRPKAGLGKIWAKNKKSWRNELNLMSIAYPAIIG
jgi:hypothetical protein